VSEELLHSSVKVRVLTSPGEVEAYRGHWTRWGSGALGEEFDDVVRAAQEPGLGFVLVVVGQRTEAPVAMLAVRCESSRMPFRIGERRIGSMRLRRAVVVGNQAFGTVDGKTVATMLYAAQSALRPDLFSLIETPVEAPTLKALRELGWGFAIGSSSRKDEIHWSILLPDSFDAYLNSLSSKTRQSVRYVLRKCEKELGATLETVNRPDQIDQFLVAGESISRQTYQWHVGQRLQNTPEMRKFLGDLASQGRLRAYLMRVEGAPCAFVWGWVTGERYHYQTPGFLREYHRWSVGTVMMMYAIRDLIEAHACRVFDFGQGGDLEGYKSRFGNVSVSVRGMDVAVWWRVRGVTAIWLQRLLVAIKNAAHSVIKAPEVKRKLRHWLRT
jgi:Acetyltransferase (GNAT) domain